MLTTVFQRWFSDETFHYTQEQREAVLDILLLVAHADGEMTINERLELEKVEERIGWEGDQALSDFLRTAEERVHALLGDAERLTAFVAAEMGRLHSDYLAHKLYELCERMATVDKQFDASEKAIIDIVQRYLPD